MKKTSVVALVDDERNIRTSLGMLLEAEGFRVRAFSDTASAFNSLSKEPADVALLDYSNRPYNGLELFRRLRQVSPMPILFLSAHAEMLEELDVGAEDYISKPFSPRLVVDRIKAVLCRFQPKSAGQSAGAVDVLQRGKLRLDPERHTCHWDGHPVMLTVTEFLILQALATRPGVVKTRDALMDAAYDDQVYVDNRTIDNHTRRLRKKFKQIDDAFGAIETLYSVGYRFRAE
jgi:two-component system, OmpR family, response regulator ChvI